VPRWESDARGRLERAAIELFAERGYEETTVAAIAERGGLTERTFFRYFADKREVLFSGAELLPATMTAALADAAEDVAPIEATIGALVATAEVLFGDDRLDFVKRRQAIIDANPVLQERELIKLDALAAVLAETLRSRGVDRIGARLAAETAIGVFKVAFAQWIREGGDLSLAETIRACCRRLLDAVAPSSRSGRVRA
jgi:AcrR family transcriptional regulator